MATCPGQCLVAHCLSRSPVSPRHSLVQLQGSPASVGQPVNTWAHTSTIGNIVTLQTGRQLSRRSIPLCVEWSSTSIILTQGENCFPPSLLELRCVPQFPCKDWERKYLLSQWGVSLGSGPLGSILEPTPESQLPSVTFSDTNAPCMLFLVTFCSFLLFFFLYVYMLVCAPCVCLQRPKRVM